MTDEYLEWKNIGEKIIKKMINREKKYVKS